MQEQKSGSKILFYVSVFGALAVIIFGYALYSLRRHVLSPDHIDHAAARIATFKQPLPSGWRFVFGGETPRPYVHLRHERSGITEDFFTAKPGAGLYAVSKFVKSAEAQDSGDLKIADGDFTYRVKKTQVGRRSYDHLMGYVETPQKAVIVQILNPFGKLSRDEIKNCLSVISSWASR